MSVDVVVVGLGGVGSAAAAVLARRGARVLGLDRHPPVHDRGASHGETRIVRTAYFEGAAYVPLLRRAYALWDELGLLTRTGGLLEADAGWVPPEAAVRAQLARAAAAGAELRFEEPVLSWAAGPSGVRVTTSAGSYDAGALVLAPGRWAPQLVPGLPVPLTVQGRLMHWFDPPGGAGPFADLPVWIWERPDGTTAYGAPAVAGESGGVKAAVHHSTCRPGADWPGQDVAALLAPLLPGLGDRVLRSVECTYTLTPEHDPVVGRHPEHAAVVVACGFSGHGFTLTPVLGEVLADLALTGATAYDLSLLDPLR